MQASELTQHRQLLLEKGWFLTEHQLGEGGGGTAYLAIRTEALLGVRSQIIKAQPTDYTENRLAVAQLIVGLKNLLGPGSELLSVYKASNRTNDARMGLEIRALTSLKHPNLVRIIEADEAETPTWYLMEYFDGGDLSRAASKFEGRPREVLSKIRKLAQALEVVHHAGFLHRDIKPENIFVGADGRWILGDFGIAFESGGERATVAGDTPMSKAWRPDWLVSRRAGNFTPTVDIYLLAKVAYALLAGPGKVPPASQLSSPDFDLRRIQPQMEQVASIQQFIADHVVLHEQDVKSRTASDFITRIDTLIESLDFRASEQLVFSFLSSNTNTHVRENSEALVNIDIRLPARTSRLNLAIRILSDPLSADTYVADHISISVWRIEAERTTATSERDIAVHPSENSVGHWLRIEVQIHEGLELGGGWYRLGVWTRGGNMISGLLVYAVIAGP